MKWLVTVLGVVSLVIVGGIVGCSLQLHTAVKSTSTEPVELDRQAVIDAVNQVTYAKDYNRDLCFAFFPTRSGDVMQVTTVPCTPKVEEAIHTIEKKGVILYDHQNADSGNGEEQ